MSTTLQYALEGAGSVGEFLLVLGLVAGIFLAIFALGSLADRVFDAE